ncbi:protein kinase [Planomonospora sp. ID67723]|uniref:protein kinase domain-containing protein n=1 Tax=Planomonospora sp. ID67723 TaxID=2738134 RepID=UPI0018C3656E|nr:protein kinase [Planomonospora sp. ID67723]MBG0827229.1 protein kinase [Planomonospora sp. ID67723]
MSEPRPLRPDEPSRLGEYRLLGCVGRGGQGAVYLGESPSGARVAVKILHDHVAGDPKVGKRFLREVEAARRVPPFCTARVLDAGTAGDRPYVVSEFIEGESLEQRVGSRGPLDPRDLQRLAVGTATALAAIHRAGIVHRDFKPANVLLGPDGPRVVDFGIARSTTLATTSASVAGTPPYMSPEQLSGEEVGPPSDLFSWAGTILFAGTGRTPFGRDLAIAVLVYRILHQECDLTGLPDDLRTIVGRCLAKVPGQRPTAEEVLLDLITGSGTARPGAVAPTGDLLTTAMGQMAQPIAPGTHPSPDGPFTGDRPGTAPPPAGFAPVSGAFQAPWSSTGPSGWAPPVAGPSGWASPPTGPSGHPAVPPATDPSGGRAAPPGGISRRGLLIGGGAALATGAVAGAAILLPRYLRERDGTAGAQPGRSPGAATPSSPATSAASPTGGPSASPSVSPSATPNGSGLIPPDRAPLVLRNGQLVQGLAVSADGRTVAAGCWDGRIRLWEVPTGEMVGEIDDRKFYVEGLALSPDGRTLVSVGGVRDTKAHVWDVASRRRVSKSVVGAVFARFSPDGTLFVTGSGFEWVRLWRTSSRKQAGASMRHTEFVRNAAFSPDGRLLATAGWDDTVRLWRTSDGSAAGAPLTGHKDDVNSVVFLDGATLASAGYDKAVRVWDVASRKLRGETFKGAESTVNTMACSPDGTLLVAGTNEHGVLLWDVATRRRLRQPLGEGQIQTVAFSGDGAVLAVAMGNDVLLYDTGGLRTA